MYPATRNTELSRSGKRARARTCHRDHLEEDAERRPAQEVRSLPRRPPSSGVFLFDPLEEYLEPSLQGFRLTDGRYGPIAWAGAGLFSEVLGLRLERDEMDLRFFNPATGRRIPTGEELDKAAEAADEARLEAQAEVEQVRREAELEIEQLQHRRSLAPKVAGREDETRYS